MHSLSSLERLSSRIFLIAMKHSIPFKSSKFLSHFGFKPMVCLSALMLLASCASKGPASAPLQEIQVSALGLDNTRTQKVDRQWWQALQNRELNAIVERALQNNPSMDLAKSRIERAQALAGLARSNSQVQLGINANLSRQLYSSNGLLPPPIGGAYVNLGEFAAGLRWDPDFFSLHATELKSALGQIKAQQAESDFSQTQLASKVCMVYIELALAVEQLNLSNQQIQVIESWISLLKGRLDRGVDNATLLLGVQAELKNQTSQNALLKEAIELRRHQLATLVGLAPNSLHELTPHLRDLKAPTLGNSLGLDLLSRRADVAAAKWQVQSASLGVEAAQLQFYPNVNLGLFAGYNSLNLNQLITPNSKEYGFTPSFSLPIFDGGRLRSQLEARESDRDQAVALYNQTLLSATQEAVDAITRLNTLQVELEQDSQALKLTQQATELNSARASAGLSGQQPVLLAKIKEISQLGTHYALQAKNLSANVELMRALGGGYETSPNP
jgi:NodT family efflux transporter outer membrane factor (OMF) lipoprotein